MSGNACRIALVVPGLCGPALDVPPAEYLTSATPALDRLLSRAHRTSAPATLEAILAAWFAPFSGTQDALPAAALSWLADTGESASDYLLRVDPVHVRADQACLRLFDASTFSLDPDEARALVESFNDFYSARGWQLQAPHPQRWYLSLPQAPVMTTMAPGDIAGEDIDGFLPAGPDSGDWHVLMNEVQMLFHDHPVNAARVARGELPVNSIWPWGGGVLPEQASTAVARVLTDDPLLIGLAQLAGSSRRDLPVTAGELPALLHDGLNLVMVDALEPAARYGDAEAWSEGIGQLERTWFAPVLKLLERRELQALELYPVNGRCYALGRHHLKHFWKRTRPFTIHCAND
ncbi:MAG: hypothetical protein ACC648_06295 [Thiohalobacterales bacterium]